MQEKTKTELITELLQTQENDFLSCVDEVEAMANTAMDISRIVRDETNKLKNDLKRHETAVKKFQRAINTIHCYSDEFAQLQKKLSEIPQLNIQKIDGLKVVKNSLNDIATCEYLVNQVARTVEHFEADSGIYFLIENNQITYIGQSVNVPRRVADHIIDKSKKFDRACYIPVDDSFLDAVEKVLISTIKPRDNRMSLDYCGAELAELYEIAREGLTNA